jgi:hypothetical protein
MVLLTQGVSGGTFPVMSNADAGAGSLRAAIAAANASADADVIEIGVNGAITLETPLPVIQSPVIITGPGAHALTIRRSSALGTPDFRIFDFASTSVSSLSGVTIANGAADQGAGIWNQGQLTISQCVITGNTGRGNGRGAGIKNSGQLLLERSAVADNIGAAGGFQGGGVDTGEGQLFVVDSTISGNQAGGAGGGLYSGTGASAVATTPGVTLLRSTLVANRSGADGGGLSISPVAGFPVALTNCTISGNFAQGFGGGLNCAAGVTRLVHCTIASNTAATRAGGLFVDSNGSAFLRSSLIARNINTERPDVAVGSPRGLVSLGHNLIGQENSSAELIDGENGDIVGNPGGPVNPLLGPLQVNFGPTPTHALLASSRAINAASNTDAPATDQQGLPRVAEGVADIGAYESNAGLPPTITCPSNLIVSNAPGQCGAIVNFAPQATGLPTPVVATSIPSGSLFPVGSTLVTVTASNAVSVTNCSFLVTVVDAEAPSITCPPTLTVVEDSPGAGIATVNYAAPLATDNCDTNLTITTLPPPGSAFPIGTTTVTASVTDTAGNSNVCQFAVTVLAYTTATIPDDVTLCPGDNVTLLTIPGGTGPFTFAWSKDGVALPGETNATINLLTASAAAAGTYCVVVSGVVNSVTNCGTVTVRTNTTATPILSQSVCPGTAVQFCTVASGTGPFSYSWLKDGAPLPGATGPCFDLVSAANSDAGTYTIVVSGACNTVTNSAVLTVWTNLSFATTPPVAAPPRTDANLCSPAIGTGPVSYQWFRGTNSIVGATTDCLALTNVSLADEGDYCVVATGLCSSATNCVTFAIQRDGTPPAIAAASILCADNSAGLTRLLVAFSEELTPATALNLANYSIPGLNITNIAGTTNGNTYLLETDAPFRCGFTYGLQVSGLQDISGEIATSIVTNLATDSLPCCNNSYVLALPAGYSLVANQLDRGFNTLSEVLPTVPNGSFVRVLKDAPRTNAISEEGYPVTPEFDTFTYNGGSWNGNPVLNPGSGFAIFVPVPTNLLLRGSLTAVQLPLPFPDSPDLVSRQVPIAGGFADIFGAPPVEGIAVYRHVSTNPPTPIAPPNYERHLFRRGVWEGGAPTADVGESWFVQAIQPVVITTNPVSQLEVVFGSTINFSVSAIGSPPLRYQWRHNGINLPGQTNSTLVITNVQLIDGGAYSVTVGNFFNTVESSTAVLSLLVFDLPNLPLTNNYADRVTLTAPSGLGNSSNVGADKEPGEPNHAGKPGGKSMWIDWQAPASGIVTFATTGSSFDTLLAAYTNGPSGLIEVASDEESGGFLTSKITFYAVAGQVYSIAVDGFGGEEGVIVLGWSLEPTTDKLPVIVEPPQSVVAAVGDTVIFNARALGQDLSYQWFFNGGELSPPQRQSPDTADRLRIKTAGPQNAGLYVVRVFEGERFIDSQPISLQFNMEGLAKTVVRVLSTDKLLDAIVIPGGALLAGEAQAADASLVAGSFAAAATASATVQRSYTGTQIFNTYGAVKQPGEPNHCGVAGGASQWFLYEPPDDGTAFINTFGSTFNTVLAVYTGPGDSFATLVEVACNKDAPGTNRSSVSFPASFGTPYYVVVDTEDGSTGVVNLNYALLIPITLTNLALTTNGDFRVTAEVTPEVPFTIQRTTNFFSWVPVLTNMSTNGVFQFIDTGSRSNSRVSYRLIQKP